MHFGVKNELEHDRQQRLLKERANKPGSGEAYKRAPFRLFILMLIACGMVAVLAIARYFLPMMLDAG